MLDWTDFASWQQRIRLYCREKENGVNILKSIDEGPFQMRRFRETLVEGEEGAFHLGPERPRVYSDLLPKDKERYNGRQNRGQENNARGTGAAGNRGAQNKVRNVNSGQARQIKCYNCNGICHIARNCTQPKRPHISKYFKDKMLLMQAQKNEVLLDEEQFLFIAGGQDNAVDEDVDDPPVQDLALNVDNVFQADECDAFDSDFNEAPTAQTMFMENLSSANPIYDEAGPSYDSDILSEVYDHDNYQDAVCEHHEVHEMHDDVQPNCVVNSDAEYTGDSNMILYDEYVKDNAEPVVQNNVSSVPHDASMMIINKMHEQTAQCVFVKVHTKVVDASLTTELATYKEQVELYERRAKFELTQREQKIEEQLRIVITGYYSKDNYLATFTPQTQLTPEQILWSKDVLKIKGKAVKEQNKASNPIKALTVYPPNTPATLVLRVLPTKSQVKINIFALIQLFLEFEKTCKKRITPTGLTEGERGFEQTNECYLTESYETERKNFLIANDNLIVDCLSKEVFYTTTNSKLTVSRFTEIHDAHTVVQARCLELEAELSKLNAKNQNDEHNELVKRFSNLETKVVKSFIPSKNLLEEENFAAFDEFMAMTVDENYDSESDTKEPPFEKITLKTNYKIKTSLKELPTDLKLKTLPDNLEYVFLEEPSFLPVIISS
uniref:Retrovirus-related Pol polyprotein from transposon TNT 1-94 n=1 Tax=Tanacetum cinerariifolium TaxID=118510 RepID=A0A6L2LGL4_TANCI|nr:hypothetical protein [Tanacetum cinerariifolium]